MQSRSRGARSLFDDQASEQSVLRLAEPRGPAVGGAPRLRCEAPPTRSACGTYSVFASSAFVPHRPEDRGELHVQRLDDQEALPGHSLMNSMYGHSEYGKYGMAWADSAFNGA